MGNLDGGFAFTGLRNIWIRGRFEEEDDSFSLGHFEHTASLSLFCLSSLPLVALLESSSENTGSDHAILLLKIFLSSD